MRSVSIVLLLAVVATGQGGAEAPTGLTPLTLPVAANGTPDKAEDDRAILNVDAQGFVHWMGKKVTLDQLGTILGNLKEKHELKLRAKDKSVVEDLPAGGKASKLFVLLRADKETPWQHVQWVLTILAEQKFYLVQFAVSRVADRSYTKEEAARLGAQWVDRAAPIKPQLAAKLDAFLPVDWVMGLRKPDPKVKAGVHIIARQEIAARWGPENLPVSKPTAFLYRMGDVRCNTLEHVHKWIGDARKAAGLTPNTKVIGEIKAGHKVPFKQVVAVLNQFHARGVKEVHFYGTSIPGKELRKLPYLPYPLKNYVTR